MPAAALLRHGDNIARSCVSPDGCAGAVCGAKPGGSAKQAMALICVDIDFTVTPISVRERLRIPKDQIESSLTRLGAAARGRVLLSTCMRTEVHLTTADTVAAIAEVESLLSARSGLSMGEVGKLTYRLTGPEVVESWGVLGAGPGDFSVPTRLVVDADGNVLVSEVTTSRVQVFGPDREFMFELSPKTFAAPHGLAFDSSGNLCIADTGNGVVREFCPIYSETPSGA